jgi:hypothetical protein
LGLRLEDIQLFTLNSEDITDDQELAVRINNSSTLLNRSVCLHHRAAHQAERCQQRAGKLITQLLKTNEALTAYLKELKKMKEYFTSIDKDEGKGKYLIYQRCHEKIHKN